MNVNLDRQRIKLILGTIIVLAAFAIILPGLLTYLSSIGRLALWICLILVVAVVLGQIKYRLGQRAMVRSDQTLNTSSGSNSDSNSSSIKDALKDSITDTTIDA